MHTEHEPEELAHERIHEEDSHKPVDTSREAISHRRHERTMRRLLRWPMHSNTPRVMF